jgi:hypothetical protein
MPENFIFVVVLLIPVVCGLVAAWPLLRLHQARGFVAKASGTGCICLGATVMGLVTSGFLPAVADDKPAEAAASKKTAEATPAEAKRIAAEADPEIDAPPDTVEIPAGRPSWVGTEANTRGKVHTVAVSSGPYKKEGQAKRALDEAIEKATSEYIADQLGSERAALLLRYDANTIKERYLKDANKHHDVARYSEPVGEMHEHFALLEFGPEFRKEIDGKWRQVKATSRVFQTGLVSTGVLMLLASVFGYFRLDNATRGYYSGRLQFMTAAAVLAVVGAGVIVAQYITWL